MRNEIPVLVIRDMGAVIRAGDHIYAIVCGKKISVISEKKKLTTDFRTTDDDV